MGGCICQYGGYMVAFFKFVNVIVTAKNYHYLNYINDDKFTLTAESF